MNGENLATAGFIALNRAAAIATRGRVGISLMFHCIGDAKLSTSHSPNYQLTSEVIYDE